MIKEIEISNIRGVIIRKPIDINEPIYLDEYIPYPKFASRDIQKTSVINYPTALNFTKRIGTVDYVVNSHFAEDGTSTLLSQFRDLILSQNLIEDIK